MYEDISDAQLLRITSLNTSDRNFMKKLKQKDRELIVDVAFKLSGKSSLSDKEFASNLESALIELACESLRRKGILMRTSKGWKETKLGKESRLKLEKEAKNGGI